MGKIKTYLLHLQRKLGKEEVTNSDMDLDIYNTAQEIFSCGSLDDTELTKYKNFLPQKSIKDFPNSNVGEVIMDNTGTYFLLIN